MSVDVSRASLQAATSTAAASVRSPWMGTGSPLASTQADTGATDTYSGSVASAPPPPPQALLPSTEAEVIPARLGHHRMAKMAFAGLALAGVMGGAVHAVDQAPVCSQPGGQAISITQGGVCVSPDFGAKSQAAIRTLHGSLHTGQLIDDLTSSTNEVFPAPAGSLPPRPLMQDGTLRVVTWNLHKEASRDADGARHQATLIRQAIRDAHADVYLFQEVAPWQARDIAESAGMTGFYTMVTPDQGDLMLVHPDLQVQGNFKDVINQAIAPGDRGAALGALGDLTRGKGDEPRAAQAVEVKLPGGQPVLLWNTHLTNNNRAAEAGFVAARTSEANHLADFLATHQDPGEPVIGGGDLNAGTGNFVIDQLQARGLHTSGYNIDWLTSMGPVAQPSVQGQALRDSEGLQLSDHPMVIGSYRVAG